MDTSRIERIAIRSIEEYIDCSPRLETSKQFNNKTPIWDGDLFVYNEEKHSLKSFIARIPLSIKGTTDTKDSFYRISRDSLEAIKAKGGGVFFLVQVEENSYQLLKKFYGILTANDVDALLQQNSKTLKLQLKEVPADYDVFQEQVVDFARKINELEISSFDANNLIPLKDDCEKLRQHISSINSNQHIYFKRLLDKTKTFIVEETFNWRDIFIQNIQGILEIAQSNKINDYALLQSIATKFAFFLKCQKRYELAEKYLKVAENYALLLTKEHPEAIVSIIESRENLVNLYNETVILGAMEEPRHIPICEANPLNYLEPLAKDYYALAYRFEKDNKHRGAEKNFTKALDIYILLAEFNGEDANEHIKNTLDILERLYEIHKNLRNYSEAERDIIEAKIFFEKNADADYDSNQIFQIKWLAKSAFLNKALKRYEDAEKEYQKCLKIYDSLIKSHKKDNIIEEIHIKTSLADLYSDMGKNKEALDLFNKSIEAYNRLDNKNSDIRLSKVKALFKFANYYARLNNIEEAKNKYDEALIIRQELNDPEDCASDQVDTLIALASLHQRLASDEAVKTYEDAIGILSELVKNDPEANIYILMDFLKNSTTINSTFSTSGEKANILKKVESKYQDFLDICINLEKNNKESYKEERSVVLNSLAHLHYTFLNYESAEKEYKELLELRRDMAMQTPIKNKDVAITLSDLGKLHSSQSNYYEAEADYNEALGILLDYKSNIGYVYDDQIARLHNSLGKLYRTLNRTSEAEDHFKESNKIFNELAHTNSIFKVEEAETLENLALLLSENHQRIQEAISSLMEARDHYDTLATESTQFNNLYTEKSKLLLSKLNTLNKRHNPLSSSNIQRLAARAVEAYIDNCPQLQPVIKLNDKTSIWDGEIYIYGKKHHKLEDFSALIHLQIKGRTAAKSSSFRIGRAYVEAYKADRGCVFILHQQQNDSSKLLYAILSLKHINALLQQKNKTIKIDLKEIPVDPLEFEKEIIAFSKERNGERIENTYPKEIKSLVQEFMAIEQHLEDVEDRGVRIELKSFLNTIKGLKNESTVGWRDTFIYLARKVLELTFQHVKKYDALDLQFELAGYLYKQRLYHIAEEYYLQSLSEYRNRAKTSSYYLGHVAKALNKLGALHIDINQHAAAESEYKEALEIGRKLAKFNTDDHLADVATTLNNLAVLHSEINQYAIAESEYKEALEIRRKLAISNPENNQEDVAMTLNNLGILHSDLYKFAEAEREFQEALEIRRKLIETNPDVYLKDVATTLNNLGNLHIDLNQYDAAESEYKEALGINWELAQTNPNDYLADMAMTLNNLATLHDDIRQFASAKNEYKEALTIYKKLAETNPEVYLWYVATTLNNLAVLYNDLNEYAAAEDEYKKALEIRWELAKANPDAYLGDVATTLYNMALLLRRDPLRKDEAKMACQDAFDLYKAMAQKTPQRWNKYVDEAQQLLNSIVET